MRKSQTQPVNKKVLVRNTEQALPSTKVSNAKHDKKESKTQVQSKHTGAVKKISIIPQNRDNENVSPKFNKPQSHSTDQLLQKMRAVENINLKSRKVKSTSGMHKIEDLTVSDKITKRVNFPYEQPIYKDLIPLCVKMQKQPMISCRDPLPLKDKVPVLSDFVTPNVGVEYKYEPPTISPIDEGPTQYYNGLRIYKIMQTWND